MVKAKEVEVKILIDTDEFSAALEKVRQSASPFVSALREVSMTVEAHIKSGARVGANKRTVAVFMAAELLYEIDQGVKVGTLDSWGYPIEDEEE